MREGLQEILPLRSHEAACCPFRSHSKPLMARFAEECLSPKLSSNFAILFITIREVVTGSDKSGLNLSHFD